jgi:GWxTD domain-containing protein
LKKHTYISSLTILILILLFSFQSCGSSSNQPTSRWDLSTIYNPLKTSLHPAYKIYHNSENTSVLFIKLSINELFFRPNVVLNQEETSFTLKYIIQEINNDSSFISDSNTFAYNLAKSNLDDYYITQIPIKAEEGKSYRLKVTLRDNYRKAYNISYINIEKKREFAEQYFNITTANGVPLFRNIVVNEGAFRINHSSPSSDTLYIAYYKNNVQAPKPIIAPPSDNYLYEHYDSLFIVDYSSRTALSLNYEGMYFIRFDTNSKEGVSILKLNEDFPKIEEPEGLIPPLSYITSDAEFAKLSKEMNPKLSADKFWMNVGGNAGKAREIIRLYYNRVYFSNYYFTSTKPGWKTDRGMVYIVYGPPHKMKKNAMSETWIYERKEDKEPVIFTFNYEPNQYNLNNFILQRSNNHTWHWTETVYAWINGDIFLYD